MVPNNYNIVELLDSESARAQHMLQNCKAIENNIHIEILLSFGF